MTLKELYVGIIAEIHKGEDVKGGFTFVDCDQYVAAHCGRDVASQAFGCQVSDAEHYFSVTIDLIVEALAEGQNIEYEWIRYIPKQHGVDMDVDEQFVRYVAIHEAAHMIETEHGFFAPSSHDEPYEVILLDLMAKYWRVT